MKRIHVWFYGVVQGVFFRSKVKNKAKSLDINGWVKNLDNGSVEAVFEGSKIDELLEFCKYSFKVDRIKIEEEKPEHIKGFEIRY